MAAEKSFENRLKDYLKRRGTWFVKYWAGNDFTKSGIPDILACDHGTFIAIEVKAQNGRPKLLQLVKLRQIREAGGYGILLYPQDYRDFQVFMDNRYPEHDFYRRNIEKQFHWEKKLREEK